MIRILPPAIAAQIAAGEVVERPASVVKELVENAIDAGARTVTVEIRGGGITEMIIRDDGSGIPADQIEVAFARHATSKLSKAEDLFAINTLGFRGEALPSIAAVAQVSCTSRTVASDHAVELRIAGSEIQDKRTVGAPVGTTFLIRNLFYNLPVRREFLRSPGAETAAITAVITHYALAYPHIRFTLAVDGKPRLASTGSGNINDVMLAVYGTDVVAHLVPIDFARGEGLFQIAINGLISDPTISRSSREAMHISVNGRAIAPRGQLAAIFDEAYHTLLMKGRFPYVVVAITVDPAAVDVNVHPTKSEVKFRDPDYVRDNLASAMRHILQQIPAIQDWGVTPTKTPPTPTPPTPHTSSESRIEYLRDLDRPQSPRTPQRERPLFPEAPAPAPQQTRFDATTRPAPLANPDAQAAGTAMAGLVAQQRTNQSGPLPELRIIGQLAGLYILAEGPDQEFYIIDQHAAHERINYERLMAQHANGKIEMQPMLIPQQVHVAPATHALLADNVDMLASWGFRIVVNDDHLSIRAIPTTVSPNRLEAALLQIADALNGAGGSLPPNWHEKMLITLACHTSIRAGQQLSTAEQQALLTQLAACTGPRTCPHGRPTIIVMKLDVFARQFGRIV